MLTFSAEERSQGLQRGQMNGAEAEEEEEEELRSVKEKLVERQKQWERARLSLGSVVG